MGTFKGAKIGFVLGIHIFDSLEFCHYQRDAFGIKIFSWIFVSKFLFHLTSVSLKAWGEFQSLIKCHEVLRGRLIMTSAQFPQYLPSPLPDIVPYMLQNPI